MWSVFQLFPQERVPEGELLFFKPRTLFADGRHTGPAAHVPAREVQRTGALHPNSRDPSAQALPVPVVLLTLRPCSLSWGKSG